MKLKDVNGDWDADLILTESHLCWFTGHDYNDPTYKLISEIIDSNPQLLDFLKFMEKERYEFFTWAHDEVRKERNEKMKLFNENFKLKMELEKKINETNILSKR